MARVRILIKIRESGINFFHFCFCSDSWAFLVQCRTRNNKTKYRAHCNTVLDTFHCSEVAVFHVQFVYSHIFFDTIHLSAFVEVQSKAFLC